MNRRVFSFAWNAVAAVSLVLCVVSAAWWVRSCWVHDTVGRVGEAKVVVANSAAGMLGLSVTPAHPENEEPGPRPYYVWHTGNAGNWRVVDSGGKVVRFVVYATRRGFGWVVVPHWVVVLATLPGAWLSLVRMRRSILAKVRRNYGHCPACGYDLRATPERCPECGMEVKEAAVQGIGRTGDRVISSGR